MPIKINGFNIKLPNIKRVVIGTPDTTGNVVYETEQVPFYVKIQTGSVINLRRPYSYSGINYKIDDGDWIDPSTTTPWIRQGYVAINVSAGQKIYLKADSFQLNSSETSTNNLFYQNGSSTVQFTVGGDLQSLFGFSDTVTKTYAFVNSFYNSASILGAEPDFKTSAKTITASCFRKMFYGCANLVSAFKTLPATTLAANCYQEMFYGCTSLINAPDILATDASNASYGFKQMFYGCTNLTGYPKFNLTGALPLECCISMFENCSSLGEVPDKFKLSATTIGNSAYKWMLRYCANLTIPNRNLEDFIQATTIAGNSAFAATFQGCSSLKKAPKLKTIATSTYTNIFEYMFASCTSLTTIELPTIAMGASNASIFARMYTKCTGLTEIPEGTFEKITGSFASNAFYYMFENCTGLLNVNSHFPESGITMNQTYIFRYMFSGCSSLTNVVYNFLPNYTSRVRPGAKYTCQYMFQDCASLIKPVAINWIGISSYCCQGMYLRCRSLQYICNLRGLDFYGTYCCHNMYAGSTYIEAAESGYAYTVRIPVEGTPPTPGDNAFLDMFYKSGASAGFTPTIGVEFTCSVPVLY